MRTLIIDDETDAIEAMKTLIAQHTPQLNIVGEAMSTLEGIGAVKKHQPDLIFLDVELGDGSGFDVLRNTTGQNYLVIFATAYDQYALEAIKKSALDYLLKPIQPDMLIEAVQKAFQRDNERLRINTLLSSLENSSRKIGIPLSDHTLFIETKNIYRINADGNYCYIWVLDRNKPYFVSKKLKYFEEKTIPYGFLRVHRKYLVNLEHVRTLFKKSDPYLELHNGDLVHIGPSYKKNVLDYFKNI